MFRKNTKSIENEKKLNVTELESFNIYKDQDQFKID